MPTQQELDDAVVAAAQSLNSLLNQLSVAEGQRKSFKQQKQDADAAMTIAQQQVQSIRDQVKTGAVNLNNAITAANAGPTTP